MLFIVTSRITNIWPYVVMMGVYLRSIRLCIRI